MGGLRSSHVRSLGRCGEGQDLVEQLGVRRVTRFFHSDGEENTVGYSDQVKVLEENFVRGSFRRLRREYECQWRGGKSLELEIHHSIRCSWKTLATCLI